VFVVESFMDELAAAARQDPLAYRLALTNGKPRARATLALAGEIAGWGRKLPERVGHGVSVQHVFGSYMTQVAKVEVAKDGTVRVRRVTCAIDCGSVVNPDTVRAQVESAINFGVSAALWGEITLKNGRVEQSNFDSYRVLASTKRLRSTCTSCRVASRRADWASPAWRHESAQATDLSPYPGGTHDRALP
jgi:isoquinoline 1-oxidoreductase beta subunit